MGLGNTSAQDGNKVKQTAKIVFDFASQGEEEEREGRRKIFFDVERRFLRE